MKTGFAFLILSYNHEKYILHTLNSIKYQVEMYGNDIPIRLFVGDDASKDRTVEVAQSWIEENTDLFSEVRVIARRNNIGTVKNYCSLVNMVKDDEAFVALAADDLFTKNDIITISLAMNTNEIWTFPYLQVVQDKICYDEKYICSYFVKIKRFNEKKVIWNFMKGSYMHSPSTLFSKKLYNECSCNEIEKEYVLFEDDPIIYKILKQSGGDIVRIKDYPLVLYRCDTGVSNTPNRIFEKDYKKLQMKYIEDSKFLKKIYFREKYRNGLEYEKMTLLRILNKIEQIQNYFYAKIICRDEFEKFKNSIEKETRLNQEYFNMIKEFY